MVLELFKEMQFDRVCPNQFTLSSVLKSCSSLSDFRTGKGIHGWILRHGIDLDMVLENSILDVYVKCGGFDYAERLFEAMEERDTVAWNIMMGACMHVGDMEKALDLFRRLPFKDVASWNTILYGLMQNGHERYALELLYEMVENGPPFNRVTFSEALVLASSLSVLELGRQIHGCLLRLGIPNDGILQTSLIDMYCKCGKMEKATLVFKTMHLRANSKFTCHETKTEIVSWSSMVSGYVHNGEYEYALLTFCSMVRERILVDRFSVTSVVSACANVGILLLGQHIHAHIQKIGYKIDVHLGSSYIDMYAKCGSLNDARMIFKQTDDLNVVLWTSMISACALHGQGREAVQLFELMIKEGIKPNEVSFVVVLNACSHAGLLEEGFKWEEAADIRRLMQKRGINKIAGQSWIQLKNQVHSFVMSDRSHPHSAQIYSYLDELIGRLKEIGYSSDMKMVMQDVEEEQQEVLLSHHSEKLAVAYGIISTTSGTPIRIMKNLRVCTDCHNFIKYTCQLLDREIIVRDSHRFHHFKHGLCSCGDYW
ncbi:hypothetical protein C1H46_033966 [Malus baccata]|uniref:DYW domain-containing protein n=1 Tax=Malus baccata TaxID=106549 RepID=A0A540L1U1_MALBA|nr:hypothetical protein C1H46_033966 [Malus baccata]